MIFAPMKLAGPVTTKIFFGPTTCCPSGYSGPEGYHPVNNGLSPVKDYISIAVKKSDDCIRSFLNTYYMIRVQVHQLFIHTSYCNHANPIY